MTAGGPTARRATVDDAARIADIFNQGIHDRVATFETEPRAVETVRGWFDDAYPVVVVELDGRVIAWASASSYRPRACYTGIAEFSVYVDREWRGHGAGTIAMQALIEEARGDGLEKLVSRVFVENDASRRMLRRLGFREVGIYERHATLDGVWRDVAVVELLLQDRAGEPRGALWQPDMETLGLWPVLRPGGEILIEKRPWEPDRSPLVYTGTVVDSPVPHPWIETRAVWTMETVDVSGLRFERGGELREFFSPRHPFNAFAVYGVDGTFRGWYGNVSWPARARREGNAPILSWGDLVLDIVLLPDGTTHLLDEDELETSGLGDRLPWLPSQMLAARDELARLLQSGFFPVKADSQTSLRTSRYR